MVLLTVSPSLHPCWFLLPWSTTASWGATKSLQGLLPGEQVFWILVGLYLSPSSSKKGMNFVFHFSGKCCSHKYAVVLDIRAALQRSSIIYPNYSFSRAQVKTSFDFPFLEKHSFVWLHCSGIEKKRMQEAPSNFSVVSTWLATCVLYCSSKHNQKKSLSERHFSCCSTLIQFNAFVTFAFSPRILDLSSMMDCAARPSYQSFQKAA